jgi:large subunit ribosomal protein L13
MLKQHTHHTKTYPSSSIQRIWRLVDADGKVLGRLASEIASMLTGKTKSTYASNMDEGDIVVVINASKVRVTGRKLIKKTYTNYSGYPGGLTEKSFEKAMEKSSPQVVRRAISGMLAKNKLRDRRLARLHIFADSHNKFESKFLSVTKIKSV